MVEYRPATPDDATSIAALHADSWRRHYRGAYSDAYLDGDLDADRLNVWTERLADLTLERITLLLEQNGVLVGFAHTALGADERWGALLDNLHVVHSQQRSGIGRRLVAETARALVERQPGEALHLWVLEQNVKAQAFYEALGGKRAERRLVVAPGGDPARLCGEPYCYRYVWPDPSVLLSRDAG